MKNISLVALMLLVAGSAAFAAMPAKKVECNVGGKMKVVKTADACTALGGTVVAAKKVS